MTVTRQPVANRIELDTPLVPRAVMEGVCEEAGIWLDQPLPHRWVRELTAFANTVYAHNPRFRRKVRGKGNSGRDYLWMFARHWLSALLAERRPQLSARLPSDYRIGRELPPKPDRPPHWLNPRSGVDWKNTIKGNEELKLPPNRVEFPALPRQRSNPPFCQLRFRLRVPL